MRIKNEFQIFCDKLSEGEENKVDYVRKQLQARCGNNTDMLLAMKAEAQEDDHMQHLSMKVSLLALIASFFGAIGNFIPDTGSLLIDNGINVVYLLLMIYAFIKVGMGDRFASVGKWRKYILVVIDDLIEESRQKEKEEQKSTDRKKSKGKGKKSGRL